LLQQRAVQVFRATALVAKKTQPEHQCGDGELFIFLII